MMRRIATSICLLLAAGSLAGYTPREIAHQAFEFAAPTYTQLIEVEFRDEAIARAATFRVLPLFEGYRRAISCRWDDNWPGENLNARAAMERHGIRGTWYLNGDRAPYMKGVSLRPVARQLLADGNSIGCHTLTHPYTMSVNRNRMFEEMIGQRIEWESALDTTINSYATAYIDYRDPAEGDASQADLVLTLERAGLYHAAEFATFHDELPSDLQLSVIMPPENADFETFRRGVDWAMNDARVGELFPCVSNSMHAWYRSGPIQHAHYTHGIEELDRRLEYLAAQADVWHTNQNAYAAYRYAFRHHAIEVLDIEGPRVRLRLDRPVLDYLNDAVPLTLGIGNIPAGGVVASRCATADVVPARRYDSTLAMLNVSHDRDRALPARIDAVANDTNAPGAGLGRVARDFPGLLGALSVDGDDMLTLQLCNQSGFALTDLRVTWRNALGWRQGLAWSTAADVGVGDSMTQTLDLERSHRGARYHTDESLFVAQVDFRFGGEPSRLYLTCRRANAFDASLPREGFLALGPIPRDRVDLGRIDAFLADGGSSPLQQPDGTELAWHVNDGNGSVPQSHIDGERLRTQGEWSLLHSGAYCFRSTVRAPSARRVRFVCHEGAVPALYLNGARVTGFEADLPAGDSDLRFVYHPTEIMGTGRNSTCLFRVADPATLERMADVTYTRPGKEPQQ